ncbi:sensor histidine kinase [Desulfosoma caldarium]|uniref:histidine kinase n=1 Tax=Desulfosoma caldarium TaxID=610254 RepID=A0A3N1VKB3_9BACT|nr:HAMP domain-containing sensor histidine kinase [Desulfosoma caldarium]ROR03245.1 phospho-acceptor domain-containing protein [Desulfosoma caldarium]
MRLPLKMKLNIRQKIAFGLWALTVCVVGVGGLSYKYLLDIEQKIHFVEYADDLSNTILEMRRYEKNFFLYQLEDALQENEDYLNKALTMIENWSPHMRRLHGGESLKALRAELVGYQSVLKQLQTNRSASDVELLENSIRERGKNLVELANQLVAFERQRILDIIRSLKTQLVLSLAVLIVFTIFLMPFVSRKIIGPLRIIEESTMKIAHGDFRPVDVPQTHDETQQVLEAFNRMVDELKRRQDQLVQTKKLASLGILTSGIAHQLNNPLNNISTSCQIALEEVASGDTDFLRRLLVNVEQEVTRARDIVRGLLEFARVKEFTIAPTPLKHLVERTFRLISSQVPSGISMEADIPEDLVVPLDSQRMQQVLLNLYMNAIQAIKDGTGKITTRAWTDPAREKVFISVEDTGGGIAPENLSRIFDPFFTTKEVGSGTGLGLSICYGIVEQHRGTITVVSHEGEGTRFTLTLPLKSPVAVQDGEKA